MVENAVSHFLLKSLADFAVLLRFFTRLPVPRLGPLDTAERAPDVKNSGWVLPFVGMVAGLPGAGLLVLMDLLGVPPQVSALLAVGTGLLATGALHEDGLGDVADGFGGGKTRERKLEIMRDSRVGSFAVVALVVVVMLRAVAYSNLVEWDGGLVGALEVLTAAAASRAALLLPWVMLPSARPDGLAGGIEAPDWHAAGQAAGLAALFWVGTCWAGSQVTPLHLALPFALGALAALGMAALARREIGGYTGDVLGATQQVTEIALLVGMLTA